MSNPLLNPYLRQKQQQQQAAAQAAQGQAQRQESAAQDRARYAAMTPSQRGNLFLSNLGHPVCLGKVMDRTGMFSGLRPQQTGSLVPPP